MQLKFKKLDPKAKLPTVGTKHSAALDLYALEDTVITPGQVVKLRTGLAWEAPIFVSGLVLPRSSGFFKSLDICSVMDSDYRGEWLIQVKNTRQDLTGLIGLMDLMWKYEENFFKKNALQRKLNEFLKIQTENSLTIKAGERFAQVIIKDTQLDFTEVVEVQSLSPTTRGQGSFGSTGT